MHDTTVGASVSPFPDDELRHALEHLSRHTGMLEPHDHAGYQVSGSEVLALSQLVKVPELSQQQLAEALGLEKSTVSRLSAGLERRGWLVRERDPDNRRLYRLRLTADGQRVAHEIGADLRVRHDRILAALTPQERQALTVGLTALMRVLAEEHPPS